MAFFDLIIIGGGAAAAAAALGARPGRILVIDVGIKPDPPVTITSHSRLQAMASPQADLYDFLIGSQNEGMALIGGRSLLSPKLKAPKMRFITRAWEQLSPVVSSGFHPQMSFAFGGLANGWGAGVYRYNRRDLAGFAISEGELSPHFDTLTKHIGISGADDDLAAYFGSASDLQPALRLNRGPRLIYQAYRRHSTLFARNGFRIGRPRLAVLSRDHGERKKYPYHNLEFFTPNESSIYSPAITLKKLIAEGKIEYAGGLLVEEYEEQQNGVIIRARNVSSSEPAVFSGKALVVAAGCLNTVKIVLQSERQPYARLPLLDNLISYVPMCHLGLIGLRTEKRCFGMGQLNIIYDGPAAAEPIQGTIYDLSGPLRSDILMDFPFSLQGKLAASRYIAQAMCLVQFFYPDDARPENTIGLTAQGELDLRYRTRSLGKIEGVTLDLFRRLGWLGLPRLCKYPPPGSSYHYAGSLPMKVAPGPLQTSPQGLLAGRSRVFIADSSVFSRLPSKNLTFASMANAMRVAGAIPELLR